MKTTEKLPQTKNSNWILIFTIFVGLLLINLNTNAQALAKKVGFTTEEISSSFEINEFSVAETKTKIYFRFLIQEDREEVSYTLESSTNGIDFDVLQLKEGFKSPYGQPLLYCYSLDITSCPNTLYRVKLTTPEGYSYSEVIEYSPSMNIELLTAQKN